MGEFASAIISHLLLLGHARVGDLMQSYGTSSMKEVTGYKAAKLEPPSKSIFEREEMHTKSNGDSSVTREKINETLCELLQYGLIVPVRKSTFRSATDNRIEAENRVGKLPDYKTEIKSKKEKDAMWEAEVTALIHQWKFGSKDEQSEIKTFKVGQKRLLENPEEPPVEKRQRLDLDASRYAIGSNGSNETILMLDNMLKVWSRGGLRFT